MPHGYSLTDQSILCLYAAISYVIIECLISIICGPLTYGVVLACFLYFSHSLINTNNIKQPVGTNISQPYASSLTW